TQPLPTLVQPAILRGPGPGLLTIRRTLLPDSPDFRVFSFAADYAELSGVTIANGRAYVGAGLRNDSQLLISNCGITANTGLNSGCGGGILNLGDLTLIDSTVTGNFGEGSSFYGAGLEHAFGEGGNGLLRLTRSVISNNRCQGFGGGMYLGNGDTVITESTV